MTTYEVTTASGQTVTRQSDNTYVAASERQNGQVRFHQTRDAARKAAGTYGKVHDFAAEVAVATTEVEEFTAFDAEGNEIGQFAADNFGHARHVANDKFGRGVAKRISRKGWDD